MAMRKSNNDSGLTALAVSLLTTLVVCLAACSTIGKAPIDDAYYWPEKQTQSAQSAPIIQNTQSTQKPPKTSPIEYTNVQDTTVTIRIKR